MCDQLFRQTLKLLKIIFIYFFVSFWYSWIEDMFPGYSDPSKLNCSFEFTALVDYISYLLHGFFPFTNVSVKFQKLNKGFSYFKRQ